MGSADSLEVSIRYDEDGRLNWVRPVRTTLPAGLVEPLVLHLFGALDEAGPPDWGFRLTIAGGDVVAVGPSIRCRPEIREEPRTLFAEPTVSVADVRMLQALRGRTYPVRISLDAEGRVVGFRAETGGAPLIVEQVLLDWILNFSYEPELHDGIGVPSTIRDLLRIPRRL